MALTNASRHVLLQLECSIEELYLLYNVMLRNKFAIVTMNTSRLLQKKRLMETEVYGG